jgi:ABC-type molybdenum transport system ATPase subunit/photorepair protein PhrA
VLVQANPRNSVHISGCRGAGKTTLLGLIGTDLAASGHRVYHIKSASALATSEASPAINTLIASGEAAYFLVDETQEASETFPEALVTLLKNAEGHKLTTIGAGVPEFKTLSGRFVVQHTTSRLFLNIPAARQRRCDRLFFKRQEKAGMASAFVSF